MTELVNNRCGDSSRDEASAERDPIEFGTSFSEFDLYQPASLSEQNDNNPKYRLARSVNRGARLNERAERRLKRLTLREILEASPANLLSNILKEAATNGVSLLFFSATVSLPFLLNFRSSDKIEVSTKPSSDYEITAEVIGKSIPSLRPLPPTNVRFVSDAETNGPPRGDLPSVPSTHPSIGVVAVGTNFGKVYSANVIGYLTDTNGNVHILDGPNLGTNDLREQHF